MGLAKGNSRSFVRLKVEGDLPPSFIDFAAERIGKFSFRDIDDSFDESSIGWVSIHNLLERDFLEHSFMVADYLVLSLRIDERKISAAALNKFVMKEEAKIKQDRQIPRLSRAHRLEIKEMVRLRLLKKAVPVPSTVDLAWNLADNTVLFFSTSAAAISSLEEFFKECFGFILVQQIPYLIGCQLLDPEAAEGLVDLTPTIFI